MAFMPAFSHAEETETVPAQSGAVYTESHGFVKTASALKDPVTDYYEASHEKVRAEDEKKKAEEEAARETAPKVSYEKPKVLVS